VAAAPRFLTLAPTVGYAHPDGNVSLIVNMTDAPAFVPRALSVPAGTNLSIKLVNQGSFPHTFTLAKQSHAPILTSWTPDELGAYFQTNGTLNNTSVPAASTGWANFTLNLSTAGGSFEFVSLVPYQFQAGMYGWINVTLSGPPLRVTLLTTDAPSFSPDALSASPSGYPVEIEVAITNTGGLLHTFTIAGQTNVTLYPGNYSQYFAQHPPLDNTTVPAGNTQTANATFVISGPGVYEFICETTGHFADGMYGHLYVGVPLPAAAPPPSTAIVEVWVLAGSGILLAIGLAIAGASALMGRLPRRPGGHGH
jgi:plastocyanin